MKKNQKIFFIFASIFIICLGFIFVTNDTFYSERAGFVRFFKQISYNAENLLATVISTDEKIKIPLKFKKQEHSVTCEIAALRMVLNYFGATTTEDELISKIVFDTKEPKTPDNIWGDPDEGFVGSVDGSIFLGTGYGVYEKPIRDLALNYRNAYIMEKATLSAVLNEVNKGNPVIVWGVLSNRKAIQWSTIDGKKITALPGEHARIIIGFSGDVSKPTNIVLMDPIYGKIRMSKSQFLSNWAKLGNKAVVIS